MSIQQVDCPMCRQLASPRGWSVLHEMPWAHTYQSAHLAETDLAKQAPWNLFCQLLNPSGLLWLLVPGLAWAPPSDSMLCAPCFVHHDLYFVLPVLCALCSTFPADWPRTR